MTVKTTKFALLIRAMEGALLASWCIQTAPTKFVKVEGDTAIFTHTDADAAASFRVYRKFARRYNKRRWGRVA